MDVCAGRLALGPTFDNQYKECASHCVRRGGEKTIRGPLGNDSYFGDACPIELLALILSRASPMTIKDFKLLQMVSRAWKQALSISNIEILTDNLTFTPEYALINPAADLTKIHHMVERKRRWMGLVRAEYTTYPPGRLATEADKLFRDNKHLRVRIHDYDLWIVDPNRIAALNRSCTRVILPRRVTYSATDYINYDQDKEWHDCSMKDFGAVFTKLVELRLISRTTLQPRIESHPHLSGMVNKIRRFVDHVPKFFGMHPQSWILELSPWNVEGPDSLGAQHWYSHNPYFPIRETLHLGMNEFCAGVKSIVIPECQKLDIHINIDQLFIARFERVSGEFPDFFYRVLTEGPVPTFPCLREIRIMLLSRGMYCAGISWPPVLQTIAAGALPSFAGGLWKSMDQIHRHYPAVTKIRFVSKWGPSPRDYTIDNAGGVFSPIAEQTRAEGGGWDFKIEFLQ